MAKTTVNLDKRVAERDFYAKANILVSTPLGDGVFHGITHSRGGVGSTMVLARVAFPDRVALVSLSSVAVISSGGLS